MKTLMVLIIAFVSASAQASNPLSNFCRAVVADPTGVAATTYPQEKSICDYQRDKGLEELGNINDPTCQHMAKRVRTEFSGKSVQFTADSADYVVYARCVAAGAIKDKGGIAIVVSEPPKPDKEREVVDKKAVLARFDVAIKHLGWAIKAEIKIGRDVKGLTARLERLVALRKSVEDNKVNLEAALNKLAENALPKPPSEPSWYTRTWAKMTGGGVGGAALVVAFILLL